MLPLLLSSTRRVPTVHRVLRFCPKHSAMSEELRSELETYLQGLDIQTHCVEHRPVFTMEDMSELQGISGIVAKNLFLKEKKKNGLYLVSARHDRQVNINDLSKRLGVGSGKLRFADEATMMEKLKVGQGSASALSLLFDKDKGVKSVVDRDLLEGGHEMVYFHPMTNAASMGLKPVDLLRFLQETGHEPILLSFD